MGFLASVFGGGEKDNTPEPVLVEPTEETEVLDPNRDNEMSEAAKARQQILAKRGRSSLVTSRDEARPDGKYSAGGSLEEDNGPSQKQGRS